MSGVYKVVLGALFCLGLTSIQASHVRVFNGNNSGGVASYTYDTSSNRLFKGRDAYGKALCYYNSNEKRIHAGNDQMGKILCTYVPDNFYPKLVEGSNPYGKVIVVYHKLNNSNGFKTSMSASNFYGCFKNGRIHQGNSTGKVLATFSNNYTEMPEAIIIYIASQLYLNGDKNIAEDKPAGIPVFGGTFRSKGAQKNIKAWYSSGKIWFKDKMNGNPDYTMKAVNIRNYTKYYEGSDLKKPAAYTVYNNFLYKGDLDDPQNGITPVMKLSGGNFYRPGDVAPNAVCHSDMKLVFLYKGQKGKNDNENEAILSFPTTKGYMINYGAKFFCLYKLYFENAAKK